MSPNSEIPEYACIPEKVYLHGKLFAVQKNGRHIVWAGSANATPQAYSSNIEAMVRLEWSSQGSPCQHLDELAQLPTVRKLSAADLVETVQDRIQRWSRQVRVTVSSLDEHSLTLIISRTQSAPDQGPDQIRAQLLGQANTVEAVPTEAGYVVTLPLTPGCLSREPAVIICGHMKGDLYLKEDWYPVVCHFKLEQENWRTIWQSAWNAQLQMSDGVLLEHMQPSLRDAIPPQQPGQPPYSSLDTPQQRFAKYLDPSQPLTAQYRQVAYNLRELDAVMHLQLLQPPADEEEAIRLLPREDALKEWDRQYQRAMQFLKEVQEIVYA